MPNLNVTPPNSVGTNSPLERKKALRSLSWEPWEKGSANGIIMKGGARQDRKEVQRSVPNQDL